jgi:hypothetical protein
MSWPTPQDFVEAIQNPQYAFADIELAAGVPEVTPLGLPKVISGQFACVFKVASAGRVWAVRCFVRDFQDNKQRYDALSKALSGAALDFTVPFHFLEKGMKIRGSWYPIIKMEWLQGRLLGDFINDNSNSTAVLDSIAQQISKIHSALKQHKIAHGDLQHGNAIVRNGKVILIDYDGMFVPGLKGMSSHEIGHRNYQHPQRRPENFDENLDAFSVWVIFASLRILSIDPSLWKRLQCGDDCIIFKAADFKAPYSSKAFDELKTHQDKRIQHFAYLLERLCYSELGDVPDFSETALEPEAAPQITPNLAPPLTSSTGSSWINDWTTQNSADRGASVQSSWITDHLPTEVKFFTGDKSWLVRAMLFGTVASPSTFALLLLWPIAEITVLAAIFALILIGCSLGLVSRYRNDPQVIEKNLVIQSKRPLSGSLTQLSKSIQASERTIKRIENEGLSATKQLDLDLRKIDEELAREVKSIKATSVQSTNALRAKKSNLDSVETSEVSAVTTRLLSQINALEKIITNSAAQMSSELSSELSKVQTTFIENFSKGVALSNAHIHGIGEKLTQRLARAGIRTAAEATFLRVTSVEGIGTQKGHAISAWRDSVLQRARSRQPHSLPANDEQKIRAKYKSHIDANTSKVASLKSQQASEIAAIRDNFEKKRREIDKEIGAIQTSTTGSVAKATQEGEKKKAVISGKRMATRLELEKDIIAAQRTLNDERKNVADLQYQLSNIDKKLFGFRHIKPSSWLKFHAGLT